MALRGSFKETDPEDVLQILALGGKSGTLGVTDKGQKTKLIFREGRIIDAFDGVRRGEEAVFALLASREGTFTFTAEDVRAEQTIHRTVPAMLLSATRRVDDLKRAREVLRGPTTRPYLREGQPLPKGLGEGQTALLRKVDGRRTLGEIVAATEMSLEDAYTLLADLAEQGVIGIAGAADEESPLTRRPDDPGALPDMVGPVHLADQRPATASELREIAAHLRQVVAGPSVGGHAEPGARG